MAKTVPIREFRADLADLVNEVADRREHIVISRRGRPAAVLVPVDEYEALEETAEILSDRETMAAIAKGLKEAQTGKTVELDELRSDLRQRRRR